MYRSLASNEPNPPTRVSELIDHTSMTWKVDVVRHFFHEINSEAILQIPLSMRKQDGCWAWLHEKSGLFTVHSAYRMLIKTNKTREDYFESKTNCSDIERNQKEWNRLWSMKLHLKSRCSVGVLHSTQYPRLVC